MKMRKLTQLCLKTNKRLNIENRIGYYKQVKSF